jgi:O-antigen ligase
MSLKPPLPEEDQESHESRWPMWDRAAENIRMRPLTGWGPGQTRTYPFGDRMVESDGVDSLYLTLALKWGLGALLFLAVWIGVLVLDWRQQAFPKNEPASFEALCAEALVPAGGAFLFFGVLSYPLTNISASMFLAAFLGLSVQSRFRHDLS